MRKAMQAAAVPFIRGDGIEPKWNLLFPRGQWYGANLAPLGGSINLTDAVFAEMVNNWKAAGGPPLPIWFNHPDDSDAPSEERKKAAGWFEDLRIGTDGLEALTRWTPNARAHIQADEYRYFSPEWAQQHTDRRTGEKRGWWLYGAALLNDPFFNELPRVAAADSTHPTPKEEQMTPEMKKRLCAALGLPETTPDEEVLVAVEAKVKTEPPDKTQAKLKEHAELVAAPLRETLAAATKRVEALEALNAKLETERFAAEAKALCEELVKAGQVLPAHTEKVVAFAKKTSLAEAREVYGALPKTPPARGELGFAGAAENADITALKAEYEAALDKGAKDGESVAVTTRRLRADAKFRPYLIASLKTLTIAPEN